MQEERRERVHGVRDAQGVDDAGALEAEEKEKMRG